MFQKFKFAWGIIAMTAIAGGVAYMKVDPSAQVPIHWNAHGEVDDWSSPAFAFALIPAIQLMMVLVMAALPVLEPRKENLGKSSKAIFSITTGMTAFFAMVQMAIIAAAFGYEPVGPRTIIASVGILLAIIGNYLGKVSPNFFVGIRTPWTLSSDTVWRKTHRVGGWLFVIGGLLLATGAMVLPQDYLAPLLVCIVLPQSLGVIGYSWLLWRKEQSRA